MPEGCPWLVGCEQLCRQLHVEGIRHQAIIPPHRGYEDVDQSSAFLGAHTSWL